MIFFEKNLPMNVGILKSEVSMNVKADAKVDL